MQDITSLKGLENIDAETLNGITIQGMHNLSSCGIKSICNFLKDNGSADIASNKTGCNSIEEVLASCTTTSYEEEIISQSIQLFPNPVKHILIIKIPNSTMGNFILYNSLGQVLATGDLLPELSLDFSTYPMCARQDSSVPTWRRTLGPTGRRGR